MFSSLFSGNRFLLSLWVALIYGFEIPKSEESEDGEVKTGQHDRDPIDEGENWQYGNEMRWDLEDSLRPFAKQTNEKGEAVCSMVQ